MGAHEDAETVHPADVGEWRAWLREHHATSAGIWLVIGRGGPRDDAVAYDDAVREALCWGWVDGRTHARPDGLGTMWFTRRNPRSAWARSNRERVADLEAEGRMQPAGRAAVDVARANGRWSVLEGPEALLEPPELASALDAVPAARSAWDAFPPSVRKQALTVLALAARAETRQKHVARIVAASARGERPA